MAVFILYLASCSRAGEPTTAPTPVTPLPPVFPTETASPLFTDTAPPPTATTTTVVTVPLTEAINLSSPLYLLADKAVWLIHPNERVVLRLTPAEIKVTCFDVWPGDDQLAYGTDTGQIYLLRDISNQDLHNLLETEPLMLFDAFPDAPYLVRIDSMSWSPDGSRLAFTVDYSTPGASLTAGYPSPPSGLWLLELLSRKAIWIESNHYLGPNQADSNLVQRLIAGSWSPDNSALLVQTYSREGTDTLILDTLEEDNLLLDPAGDQWSFAAWRRNSQAVLLSGKHADPAHNLVQVQRNGTGPLVLVDGERDGLVIFDAVELPAGIAFMANCTGCSPDQTRLYFGHQVGSRFAYTASNIRQYCQNGAPRHIQWDDAGQSGVLDCGPGELRLLQFEVDNLSEFDLSSYLSPLGGAEVLNIAWGASYSPTP